METPRPGTGWSCVWVGMLMARLAHYPSWPAAAAAWSTSPESAIPLPLPLYAILSRFKKRTEHLQYIKHCVYLIAHKHYLTV